MSQDQKDKKIIKVAEFLTANELAVLMNVQVTQIISICMSIGLFVSINQRLDAETITLLADEFGFSVQFIGADTEDETEVEVDSPEDLVHRSPIVTVMGHVDHGKTSLLDYIRNANVIAGEAGGITQHIGAYEVKHVSGKRITFLDTPGHEAFTAMRARGAKITDIAIIVIAADDTIMPQTVEAINHAQAADVQMIFAINKIDKPNANPEKIREGLAQMNILVEEWGGKYQCQEISAKKGLNIDLLLEKVLIEAEMLELKANPKRIANGTVIESSLDKGKGYVAKILVQNGTLKIGDIVVAGTTYGRVKAMYNERNAPLKEAGPSVPLLLLGLNAAPQAGDTFKVYKDEHEAKNIANKRAQLFREQGIRTQKHITLDEIGRRIAIGDFKELNVIVKGDVDGSVEALSDSLLKLSSASSQVQVNVIHKSVGSVTESDVLLASASNAIIIAFQVRPSLQARKLAETEEIDIRIYSVIYNAINEIKDAIEGMLSPEIQEKIICNIEVREVFKITKVGTIAGCMMLDGKINRNTRIRVIRNGIVVYSGKLASLKRFKDEVKEVFAGQDCGLNIENYNDIKVDDIIEGYEEIEVKRTLK
jgi:translation initiation factor IF-2